MFFKCALCDRRTVAAGVLLLSSAVTSAQESPPLLPDEVYAKTQNGCGVIVKPQYLRPPNNDAEAAKKFIGEMVWTGSCANGLAEGKGNLGKAADLEKNKHIPTFEYATGRQIPKFSMPGTTVYSDPTGKRSVSIPNIANPYAPLWNDFPKPSTTLIDPDSFGVQTWLMSCFIDQKAFSGCDLGNDFKVYGVRTWSKSNSTGVTSWCPNPRTSNGCEALWQEKAGPIITRIKAFVDEMEKKIAADKLTYAELTLPFNERSAQKKLAKEAEEKQQAIIQAKAREKDREIAALEQQERDELDAREKEKMDKEKAKAERAFQANLSKLNAGQLYALADKSRGAGELDKAREILRTLITRFPNNPLVALAAQQMSQLPASKPADPPAAGKPPPPTPTKQSKGGDTGLEEMAGAFGRPSK